jgi:mersacidin/lichenicidin family type 2 lantibiotic
MNKEAKDTKKKALYAVAAANGLLLSGSLLLTAEQIVKAWESPEYRLSLTEEQQKALPSNPAGDLQFSVPNSDKVFEIAGTQYAGCGTQYAGCGTQYAGCGTQYAGCGTQYAGCSTEFESCSGFSA